MSPPYSGDYMEDRVYGAASPSPLEQEHIDKAIAASLALPQSPDGLPAVATTDDKWVNDTRETVSRILGLDARHEILSDALHASAEPAKHEDIESGQSNHPKPWTITHMVEDMKMRLAVELPLLNDSEADTLVFIDPASQQPSQDDYAYRLYATRYRLPHRMRREKFLALHSPYFEKAFGPSNQHRVLRRRGLVNKLPEGIRYVLDLTPPVEGEDAVYLMTELCCSIGVRRWFQAGPRWNVAKRLVGGQDEPQMEPGMGMKDAQTVHETEQLNTLLAIGADNQIAMDTWTSEPKGSPSSGAAPGSSKQGASVRSATESLPLEYTAVRHRAAIERVLHAAVEGLDPRIDSAPKLWTTFAVAKYFEITHSPLKDYIISWLRAPPNSYFLEVLPETSQKIADGLQCWDLCRDTFAILVGEEALGNVCRTRDQPIGDTAHNVHGRSREDVHEDYQTRIEYASKSFIERVGSRFGELVNGSMTWLDDIPAYSALSGLGETPEYKEVVKELRDTLKAYVRGRIYWVCCRDYKGLIGPVPDTRRIGSELFPTTSFTETYNGLLLQERIFTRSFWETLKREDFSQGLVNTYTNPDDLLSPIAGWTSLARTTYNAKSFEQVAKRRVEDLIEKLDDIHSELYPSKKAETNQAAIPRRADWWSYVDEPVKRFGGLSLLSPKKAKIDRTDETNDGEHDGKRRRLSSALEDGPLTKEGSQSSSQLPFRLAPATLFSKENVDILPPLLKHRLNKLTSPGNAEATSDATIEVIRASILRGEAPVFTRRTTPGTLPSQTTSSPAPIVHNHPTPTTAAAAAAAAAAPPPLDPSQQTPAPPPHPTSNANKYTPFDLDSFLHRTNDKIVAICSTMLAPPDASTRPDTLDLLLTDTLVCLDHAEWKFLPLWAGGNDDGTGGVFDDSVPLAEAAVSAATHGPAFHTGLSSSSSSSSRASSDYELVRGGGASSSLHTSTLVNVSVGVGASEQMDRRRVYEADDSVWDEEVVAAKGGDDDGGGGGSTGGGVTGPDDGIGRGKGKGKVEYAGSEWSEVTVGKEEEEEVVVDDLRDDVKASMMDGGSGLEGGRREVMVQEDELFDDVWDDDDGDDGAEGMEEDDGEDVNDNNDDDDGEEDDEDDEEEDMVLL